MKRTTTITIAIALFAVSTLAGSTVSAQEGFGLTLQGGLAMSAEGEFDKVTIEAGGEEVGEEDGDDEDLEDNLSADLQLAFPLGGNTTLAIRGGYLGATGDDSEVEYTTYDAGAVVSHAFPMQGFTFRIFGGGGATYLQATSDEDGEDLELDGWGYHFLGGAGVGIPLSGSTELVSSLMYHRLVVAEAQGDLPSEFGDDVSVTAEEVVASHVMLTAGVRFGL